LPRRTAKEASEPLEYIRRLVLTGHYFLSDHVKDDLASGEYWLEDIEVSITHGSIRQRQTDEMKQAVDGWKYIIAGPGVAGSTFETVGKVIEWLDGQVYFLITAYGR